MPRLPDPSRKPELLAQILDYLMDRPLATISLRTLAQALGVSPYSLVYHFGTRADLVREIVEALSARQATMQKQLIGNPRTLEGYIAGVSMFWKWALEPSNRQLQRLEFEASLLETLDPESGTSIRTLFGSWFAAIRTVLIELGLEPADAEIEARLLLDGVYGMQFDLVINDDPDQVNPAWERALTHHRNAIARLLERGTPPA